MTIVPPLIRCTLVVLGSILLLAGCEEARERQEDFVDQAFSQPSGFTQTDETGAVVSEDTDDWRTSPVYAGIVEVDPAFPNPTSGDFVTIPLTVRNFNSVPGGLKVGSFDETNRFVTLDAVEEARDPGAYIFSFNPSFLGRKGLVRVLILDGFDELVSYGDLMVQ